MDLENIEHLNDPARFVEGARRLLDGEGALVVSTPNGRLTERDHAGKILNPFHVREFTDDEFRELLRPHFSRLKLFGQWKTPERLARLDFEGRLFETLCELYYSPGSRLWRALRKLLGRPCPPAPQYTGEGSSYPFDFTIQPLDLPHSHGPPTSSWPSAAHEAGATLELPMRRPAPLLPRTPSPKPRIPDPRDRDAPMKPQDPPLSIGYLSPGWPLEAFANGIVSYIADMADQLPRMGHRVTILANDTAGGEAGRGGLRCEAGLLDPQPGTALDG